MDVPKDENPEILTSFFGNILGYLSSYGWHLLFFLVTANLIWSQVRPKLRKWQERRQELQLEEEYNQNPERWISLQEGLERSRQRLQEEHDRKAREHAEKLKQAEEEKRLEKIKKWECLQKGGSSSKPLNEETPPSADGNSSHGKRNKTERLRGQDYNPLMGGGASSGTCYRPSRSFGSRGGG